LIGFDVQPADCVLSSSGMGGADVEDGHER
jgi:hypothetical protein